MGRRLARGAAALCLGVFALTLATGAEAAHRRHRHHRPVEAAPLEDLPPAAVPLQDGSAYRSGYAFGLLDLGISGTPTAISPYVGGGYGYVRPGYDGPGFGYPGY